MNYSPRINQIMVNLNPEPDCVNRARILTKTAEDTFIFIENKFETGFIYFQGACYAKRGADAAI